MKGGGVGEKGITAAKGFRGE
jgi:hypothetical protein